MVILAAIDVEESYERVITVGQDLAGAYGDDLTVLYVRSEEEYESEREDVPEYPVTQAETNAAKRARRVVEETLDSADGIETVGRIGDATTEVLSVADEYDARYVVIGGRKRTPTGKALFGSTTQSVLLNADRPVVTVMADRE